MNFLLSLIDILKNTLLITGLVMVMMLLIEYINVASHGERMKKLQRTPMGQLVFAIFLGLIPGCIGGFTVVSLFTHNIINFGALVAAMIVATGDESFVLFATAPQTAIYLNLILIVLAIGVGLLVNKLVKKSPAPFSPAHFALHSGDHCHHEPSNGSWKNNLKHISFHRALLIAGIVLFIVALASGSLDHSHEHEAHHDCTHTEFFAHEEDITHDTEHESELNFLFNERWLNLLFAAVSVFTLAIIVRVNDHFLTRHLWEHVIKKHFLKIFLWTLAALTLIFILMQQVDIQHWISDNKFYMLMLAILIGIIPESGPHMIFITLFVSGNIPFSILLANSIVHEGHSALPLLAESKRSFVWMKGIKICLALVLGLLGYYIGF